MLRNEIRIILEILFDKFVLISYFGFLLTLFLIRLILKTPKKRETNQKNMLISKEVKESEDKQKEENEPPFTRN